MATDTTAVASTTSGSFEGADVDALDKLAQDFQQAAQICDEVRMACEVIVAVASFFGPFGAAFVAYLKGTVIPWLKKISEALKLMAQVLSMHSQAQKDASSATTSLPSYTTPTDLPTTNTRDYPVLPAGVGTSVGTTPPSSTTPVGEDTVGFLTVPVRISPDGDVSGLFQTPSSVPPDVIAPAPVDDAPVAPGVPVTSDPVHSAIPPVAETQPVDSSLSGLGHLGSGGGLGGGGLGGGASSGGGTVGGGSGDGFTPAITSSAPTIGRPDATLTSAITPEPDAAPDLRGGGTGGGSHDGLFSGIGQATGIGAGGAALARAVLAEAKQRATGGGGGALSPFDSDADPSVQSQIFQGSIG